MHKSIKNVLVVLFSVGFLWNGYLAVSTIHDHSAGMNAYESIRNDAYENRTILNTETSSVLQSEDEWWKNLPDIDETALSQINSEYAAWIYIPDTKIDYPVVYPENNTRYLTRTFDGKKRACGCLFFDSYVEPFSSHNTIIHGHNMKAGDMFGGLKRYLSQEYADEHSDLFLYKRGDWFRYRLYSVYVVGDGDAFPYQMNFPENGDYEKYLVSAYMKSTVKNTDPAAGDEILTLSTCHGKTQKLIIQWALNGSENKEETK